MSDAKPVATLRVDLSDPPPVSVNRLYSSGPNGQRFLTPEGRKFKDALKAETFRATLMHEEDWSKVVDLVYKQRYYVVTTIHLYLSSLYNRSWSYGGGTTKSGARQSPFRKVDAANYEKLISDAVSEGTGIDDSCVMEVRVRKHEDNECPRVEVIYEIYPDPT